MRFETPLALALLLLCPLLVPQLLPRRLFKAGNSLIFTSPTPLPSSPRLQVRLLLLSCLKLFSFALLVLALARPQTGTAFVDVRASGRDILLTLDVSGSMEALDFFVGEERVTRLDALKRVTKNFVKDRIGDRLGIILFGENVFTQSPLTLDHRLIADLIDSLEIGMAGDGTALG
jgi:Ca-activated chloride channel family protein